ncbi:MAG: GNAT family N-acetyltransferase [Deltaproteobacteria bacterium]|nr:GNAT family N-acetyltransferase [Deltaproteobacteria bacterium]
MTVSTRPIDAATLPDALALNNAHAIELSLQTSESFARLVERAFFARWTAHCEALLIAFDEAAPYENENFLWFRARHSRFVYVDRVVVRPEHRGRGLARALYAELFARARAAGKVRVVCEVNSEPPNPASDAFHAALGFREVGSAKLQNADKRVTYLELAL